MTDSIVLAVILRLWQLSCGCGCEVIGKFFRKKFIGLSLVERLGMLTQDYKDVEAYNLIIYKCSEVEFCNLAKPLAAVTYDNHLWFLCFSCRDQKRYS